MTAARQNRVMTVKQETVGTKKDFGLVGFLEEKNVSYLIFPKSLSPFKDHKIVGIKYDKVQPSKPLGRVVQPSDSEAPRSKRIRTTADLRPTLRGAGETTSPHFKVTVRFSATADITQQIEARSKAEARARAVEVAVPDLSRATITRKVLKIQRVQ